MLGVTIENMDKGIQLEDLKKNNFLADKIGISNEKTLQEIEKVNLTEIFSETDGVMKILKTSLRKQKQLD